MLRLALVIALLALTTGGACAACAGLGECALERAAGPARSEPDRGPTLEVNAAPALQGAEPGSAVMPRDLEMRLWMRRGAASFGAGLAGSFAPSLGLRQVPWRRGEAGPGELVPQDMLVGVRYNIAAGSRVFADHVTSSLAATPWQAPGLDRSVRVGLEFKTANSAALAGLPAGTLLRLQLSRDANLALRPRHGGLALTLRSQW